jgi:hypothetical protein
VPAKLPPALSCAPEVPELLTERIEREKERERERERV